MHQRAFDYSYQAFTADGARWLVDNTDIALIGIDYLSIAVHDDLSGPHDIVLEAGAPHAAVRKDPLTSSYSSPLPWPDVRSSTAAGPDDALVQYC